MMLIENRTIEGIENPPIGFRTERYLDLLPFFHRRNISTLFDNKDIGIEGVIGNSPWQTVAEVDVFFQSV